MKTTILALDQSTSSSKAFLVDHRGEIISGASYGHKQQYPKAGYVEQDANEIWQNVQKALKDAAKEHIPQALSICNQRETLVVWNKITGEPLAPAISWQDTRGADWCKSQKENEGWIYKKTGLQLSPYYSGAKAGAVLRENPLWKEQICIGTIDSYLIFRLTNGKTFKTDVSNASRTQLMNLSTLQWDEELCRFFGVPISSLPEIVDSDALFGKTMEGIPILGVMGDSHAALFAQGCSEIGMAKATYGTGSSVMLNIGNLLLEDIPAGLNACVGYRFKGKTNYVLEGNVISSGDTLQWLIHELGLFNSVEELSALAAEVSDSKGVYLVPAFSGLGTPYNNESARALITGISRGTNKKHIAYAALASIAQQDSDIIQVMNRFLIKQNLSLTELRVDGEPTRNPQLMQLQADLINCPVQCSRQRELSAIGVALMGGLTLGLYPRHLSWPDQRYLPVMDEKERTLHLNGWQQAISRAIN